VDPATVRQGLSFSIPLMIPALSFLILQFSDRFFLARFHSLRDVGLYSFAYTLVNTVYAVTATVIHHALLPHAVRTHNEGSIAYRDRILTQALKGALATFVIAAGVLIVAADIVIRVIGRDVYTTAGGVLPLLVLSYVLVIIGHPAYYLLMLTDRTRAIMVVDLFGLILAVLLNVLLIPSWSYYGAAVATVLSFTAVTGLRVAVSRAWEHFDTRSFFSWRFDIGTVAQRPEGERSGEDAAETATW